jgi:hypothetical protein
MALITITLADQPQSTVSIHTTYTPALGARCTPAQGIALDLHRAATRRAEVISTSGDPATQAHERTAALLAQHSTLAQLLTRARQTLGNLADEGCDTAEENDQLHALLVDVDHALREAGEQAHSHTEDAEQIGTEGTPA